jgi:hypothetical protein
MTLSRSEKVTVIKRIGEALSTQGLVDVDLALDTFGATPTHRPGSSATSVIYRYVVERLTASGDDILPGLYAHLYPDDAVMTVTSPGPRGPWKASRFRLFFSHTSGNKQLAGEVAAKLEHYGIEAFVAHDAVEPTKQWQDEIEDALHSCNALAALWTDDFLESKWCDQEVGMVSGRRLPVLAISQGADPHGFVGKFQAIKGDADARVIAARIFDTLHRNPATRTAMAPSAAYVYSQSGSFDSARANYARLIEIPKEAWTDEMVELVEREGRDNTQLRYGIEMPSGRPIPNLVTEHLNQMLNREPVDLPVEEEEVPF